VAYGPDGTALCAFIKNENDHYNLYCARFDGSAWSPPIPIDSGVGENYHPDVAIDGEGRGLCVFYRVVDEAVCTYATYYSGGEWDESATIGPAGSIYGVQPDRPPELAFYSDGEAFCVFNVPCAPDPSSIYANRFNRGMWEEAIRIDGGPDGHPWIQPDLDVNVFGDAICVFTRKACNDCPLWWESKAYANVYTNGSGWGGPDGIGQDEYYGFSTCVGLDGFGGAVSVFIGMRHISCGFTLSADVMHTCANYHAAGGWTGWEYFGGRGDIPTCCHCENPDVAVDHYGNALCVYELTAGVESRIYAVRYTSDVPTPTPTPTASPTPTPTPTWDGVYRINFQPTAAMTPPRYMIDDGSPFAQHGIFQYGWQASEWR